MVNSSGADGGAGGTGNTGIDGGGSGGVDSTSAGGSGGGTQHPSVTPTTSALMQLGCGPAGQYKLNVTTTTGRNFSLVVDSEKTVVQLKKVISKSLKVSKDRICLLHRERVLHDGTLRENGLVDGSKIILTPNVETGLLAQRAENTVMQALESLNDKQVNDFLSGKSPLSLSVRLGDHLMLIQLQLSTLNPSAAQAANVGASGVSFSGGGRIKASTSSSAANAAARPPNQQHVHNNQQRGPSGLPSSTASDQSPATIASSGSSSKTSTAVSNEKPKQQQMPLQSAYTASSLTSNQKANILARRPVATSSTSIDAPGDDVEQPAVKRQARQATPGECEPLKTPKSIAPSNAKSSNSNTTHIHHNSNPSKNNNQSTGENNIGNRNNSNISNSVNSNHNTINFIADQQQGNEAQIKQQPGEKEKAMDETKMDTDNGEKKEDRNTDVKEEKKTNERTIGDKQDMILASEQAIDTSNNLKVIAPGAVPSPIKSLSKLVSTRITTNNDSNAEKNSGVADVPTDQLEATSDCNERDGASVPECSDPITANLTSCLCRRLDGSSGGAGKKVGMNKIPSDNLASAATSTLHRTALNPIAKHKAKLQTTGRKTPALLAASAAYVSESGGTDGLPQSNPSSLAAPSAAGGEQRSVLLPTELSRQQNAALFAQRTPQEQQQNSSAGNGRRLLFSTLQCAHQKVQSQHPQVGTSPLKNPALAEASRNLTQTLRKLSKRVLTNNGTPGSTQGAPPGSSSSSPGAVRSPFPSSSVAQSAQTPSATSSSTSVISPSASSSSRPAPQAVPCASGPAGRSASSGAVIESMKHHGKGVYSGTFSGTLNPALQDKFGRPKRDISTIIHILNDLLTAAPQCAGETSSGGASSSTGGFKPSTSTLIYFDPSVPAGAAVETAKRDALAKRNIALASSSASSLPQRHTCNHHNQGNRYNVAAPVQGSSNTSWFVPAPSGSKKTVSEESKNPSQSGVILPTKPGSTSVHISNGEGLACVGCKLPGGSTNKDGSSSNSYRSLLISSADGSTISTKLVHLSPSNGSPLVLCKCGTAMLLLDGNSAGTDGTAQHQKQCKLCMMKAVELENTKTKLKLDSLRLIMKQKRERREARKMQSSPYPNHSTVAGASVRMGASDATQQQKLPIVNAPGHTNPGQKSTEVAECINNGRVVAHVEFKQQQTDPAAHETKMTSPMVVEAAKPDPAIPVKPHDVPQVQDLSIETRAQQNDDHKEPSTSNSDANVEVPFPNPAGTVETANTEDAINLSEASKEPPTAPTTASETGSASSTTDAATNTGAPSHLVEEVDSVA